MLTKLNKHISTNWIAYSLLSLAVIMRLIFMLTQGLSHDELSAWNRTHYDRFAELVEYGIKPDMHPAFMQLFLWYWVRIFGDSEFIFRLPALLFSIVGMLIIYRTGTKFYSKQAGILALASLATLVFPILHSTLSRPYAAGFFFLSLLIFALHAYREAEKKSTIRAYLLLILVGLVGSMYSHYYAFLCAAWISFISLFYIPKKKLLYFIITGGIALALFVPHLSITAVHLNKGGLGWLGKPNSFWLIAFFEEFFNHSRILFFAVFGLLSVLYFTNKRPVDKKAFYPLLVFFGMYFIGHAISILYTPILREPGQLFTIAYLFLGIGYLLKEYELTTFNKGVLLAVLLLGAHSLTLGKLTQPVHFEPFREVVGLIDQYDKKIDRKDVLRLTNVTETAYLDYYGRKTDVSMNFDMTMIEEVEEIYELGNRIDTSLVSHVMLARVNRQQNPIQYEIIRSRFPTIVKHADFFNANFSVWKKGDFSLRTFRSGISKQNRAALFDTWQSGTSNNEFFGNLKINVGELRVENTYLLVKAQGSIDSTISTLPFVTVLERNGEMVLKDGNPLMYQAWDQCKLPRKKDEFYTAFELPQEARDSDEVHIYFWNPTKGFIELTNLEIYVVDPNY